MKHLRRGCGCVSLVVGLFCLWALWLGVEDNWRRGTFDALKSLPTRVPGVFVPPPTPTTSVRVVYIGTPPPK